MTLSEQNSKWISNGTLQSRTLENKMSHSPIQWYDHIIFFFLMLQCLHYLRFIQVFIILINNKSV